NGALSLGTPRDWLPFTPTGRRRGCYTDLSCASRTGMSHDACFCAAITCIAESHAPDPGPPTIAHTARLVAIATTSGVQQVEISALHQIETSSHEADRTISQVVRFPGWTGRNAGWAE